MFKVISWLKHCWQISCKKLSLMKSRFFAIIMRDDAIYISSFWPSNKQTRKLTTSFKIIWGVLSGNLEEVYIWFILVFTQNIFHRCLLIFWQISGRRSLMFSRLSHGSSVIKFHFLFFFWVHNSMEIQSDFFRDFFNKWSNQWDAFFGLKFICILLFMTRLY